ncbi:MAG: insulinase family protein [Oscillospiraceae bacterium]|jgi:predicted Zn-dependent peptidase|nr:insulinase family protein [Oscillospiraceae bacterium]
MSETIREIIRDEKLGEEYFRMKHPSGLEILVFPMPDKVGTYALFTTNYGSIDTAIVKPDGTSYEIPEGTAHFLEHKMFEMEDGSDAFELFTKTGANCNAWTSLDYTSYMFAGAGHTKENLESLLEYVTHPYFSEKTVQKEQGIIGQEIRMRLDQPGSTVFWNLMSALYKKHPVGIEIAGTEESIFRITAEILYDCVENFYTLHNMALVVTGNADPDEVLAVCNAKLEVKPGTSAKRCDWEDTDAPTDSVIRVQKPMELPLFELGFKEAFEGSAPTYRDMLILELIMDAVAGECSPLYESLMNDGLVNSIYTEAEWGNGYAVAIYGAESKQPEVAASRICAEIERVKAQGLSPETFERSRRRFYAMEVRRFNEDDAVASALTSCFINGHGLFDRINVLRSLTLEDIVPVLQGCMRPGFSVLSIAEPLLAAES